MKYKVGMCQMLPAREKEVSMDRFKEMAAEAASKGAEVLVFPEMWVCPYDRDIIKEFKEPEGGGFYNCMKETAAELGVYIFGGSMPEEDGDKIYNTSFAFDRQGNLIGKHRKVHMFDIDVPGRIKITESSTITPGDKATIVETEFGKIGLAICFDIRFAELHRKMALEGANLIVLPGVFNLTTGPAHWDISVRMRAIDNQIFFAGVQAARDPEDKVQAWGHSLAADPWGEVLASADETPQVCVFEVDTDVIDRVRGELPIMSGLKPEIYK